MKADQKSQLKLLIAKGKEQGYLTYREVNDHLPNDIVDPAQIEDIVSMINDMGIVVHETAPDAESTVLSDVDVDTPDEVAAEEAAAALANVDSEFGRTTDPVRMYMREMGTVELLTREGEIEIAKRIEDGVNQVFTALSHYPGTLEKMLAAYEAIEKEELRLIDIITGFRSDEDDIIVNPNVVAPNPGDNNSNIEANSDDDDDDDSVSAEDQGPDPEEAKKRLDTLKSHYSKYSKRAASKGRDKKSLEYLEKAAEEFCEFKLVPKFADSLVKSLRSVIDRVREHERTIMDFCVTKAKMPRKNFITTFPDNETDTEWLKRQLDSGEPYVAVLQKHEADIRRAQNKIIQVQEESGISIKELKEINRRMSIGEARKKWLKLTCDWLFLSLKNTPTAACNSWI